MSYDGSANREGYDIAADIDELRLACASAYTQRPVRARRNTYADFDICRASVSAAEN